MKQAMIILGFLFGTLWLAGLFYTKTFSIHIALIISLLFFMRSVMVNPVATSKNDNADA
jgi:hypothetical protein